MSTKKYQFKITFIDLDQIKLIIKKFVKYLNKITYQKNAVH